MKRIIEFSPIIMTFFIILLLAVIILKCGLVINEQSKDVLLISGAVISTFFLFLAFRESRKSNRILLSEKEFERYEKKILEQEAKKEHQILSPDTISSITQIISNLEYLQSITYSNFGLCLPAIPSQLLKSYQYINIINSFKEEETIPLPKDEQDKAEVVKLSNSMLNFEKDVNKLFKNIQILFYLYDKIDYSRLMIKERKYELIDRLNEVYFEYTVLLSVLISKESGIDLEYTFIRVKDDKINKHTFNLYQYISHWLKMVDKIRNRYPKLNTSRVIRE